MYPVLDLFGINFPMYSLMITIGVTLAIVLDYFLIYKKEKISKFTSLRLVLVAAVSGLVMYLGAFIFDGLFHSIAEGELSFGGITYLGGVVTAFPFCIFLIHKFVPVSKGRALYTFSLLIPSICLAHAFGRLGCFFAGCCYGAPTESVFGVVFPKDSDAAITYGYGVKVHPTQLYEAVYELLLCTTLLVFRKKTKGKELEIYCFAYGIFRFALEFLRGDSRGSTGLGVTPAQLLDVFLVICGELIILYKQKKILKKLNAKCEVWVEESKRIVQKRIPLLQLQQSPQDVIKELFEMKERGIITQQEFENKKKQLLEKIG